MAVAGVTHGNALHSLPQGRVGNPQKRMQMIGHPAKAVYARIVATHYVCDDVVEHLAVSGASEEYLAVVATKHDMIEAVRNMHTRRSGIHATPG